MFGIVVPDLREHLREQLSRAVESDNDDQKNDGAREVSDAENIGSDRAGSDIEMDGNDDTQEDSVGR
ncbi:hypothetical protein ACS0TY_019564 [Phlomoides rotata]